MSTIAKPRTYTPEELLRMPDGDRYELVDGNLVELNVSAQSSLVAAHLLRLIGNYCETNQPAWIFGADCGFRCFARRPGKVRKPDGALILHDRLAAAQLEEGFLTVAPDLAIEVVSPNDLASEVAAKVEEYLDVGVRLVWVVYPTTRQVYVHRRDRSMALVRSNDELTGEDVLPGFRCRLDAIFAVLPPPAPVS
jgi:Uma2 family endonuclease